MYIKILSNASIVICCTILGMQLSERLAKRLYNIKTLRSILLRLETEIVNYSTMLPQAIRNSTEELNSQWDIFFRDFATSLENNREDSMDKIWIDCLTKLHRHPFIGEEELGIISRLGVQLGTGGKMAQQKYFNLAQEQLKTEEDNVIILKNKYSRMYRSLGLLVGLAISIILF